MMHPFNETTSAVASCLRPISKPRLAAGRRQCGRTHKTVEMEAACVFDNDYNDPRLAQAITTISPITEEQA
jgi:hypothetical protein